MSSLVDTKPFRPAEVKSVLTLDNLDTNLYRGYSPDELRWGRIYGGQSVAQALRAAQQTVDESKKGFYVHSLHGYFLRAGDDDFPIYYYVDRLRDGATFCIRRVTAVQKGQEIYTCLISFHCPEVGLDHQDIMPKVPPPEDLPTMRQQLLELAQNDNLPKRARDLLKHRYTRPAVFEIKWTDPVDGTWEAWSQTPPKRPPSQCVWMRTRIRLPDEPSLHHAAIAYMSDWALINVVARPHGVPTFNDKAQVTSLDHAVWFHRPDVRADDWLLVSIHSPRLTSSRALITSKFFTRDGVLVASVSQEALFRIRATPLPRPPKTASSTTNSPTSASGSASTSASPSSSSPSPSPASSNPDATSGASLSSTTESSTNSTAQTNPTTVSVASQLSPHPTSVHGTLVHVLPIEAELSMACSKSSL